MKLKKASLSQKNNKKKLILLDIGNTSVTYGFASEKSLQRTGSTKIGDIPKIIRKSLKSGENFDFIVSISSVVPKSTRFLKKKLGKIKRISLLEAGKSLPIPVKHDYKKGAQLGMDRLVCIYGARELFKPPLLVIDFGTAITADYVSKKGFFKGGMIIPGPEISFQALLDRAAQIPGTLRLPHKSKSFLGRSTYDCIETGILEGFGAMTDGLIKRFRDRYGKGLKVVTTGGFGLHLGPFIRTRHVYEPDLPLKALHILTKSQLGI